MSISVKSITDDKKAMGIFRRLIGIYIEPIKTFQALNQKPDLLTGLLIVITGSVLLIVSGIILNFRNLEFAEQLAQLPQENIALYKYGGSIIGGIFGIFLALLFLFIKAGIIHVLAPFLNGKSNFKTLLTILSYASAPLILFGLLSLLRVLFDSSVTEPIFASPVLFFDKDKIGIILYTFYARLDLFSFWVLFLSIIGVSVIYQFSWKKSGLIILLIWLSGIGLELGLVKIFQPLINPDRTAEIQSRD